MQKLPRLENRAPGIPSTTVTNQIAEAVNAMQATIVTGQEDEVRGPGGDRILISNSSGIAIPQYGILGINGMTNTSYSGQPVYTGVAPTMTNLGKFVITAQALAIGAVGKAYLSGVTWALVDFTAANLSYADVQVDATPTVYLKATGMGQARIIIKQTPGATGQVWCSVHLNPNVPQTIPVAVVQTGGTAGTRTTACSFTYTIKELVSGANIATAVAVSGNAGRVLNAAMTAGTFGTAYRNSAGTWKLLWVDEKFTQTNCT